MRLGRSLRPGLGCRQGNKCTSAAPHGAPCLHDGDGATEHAPLGIGTGEVGARCASDQDCPRTQEGHWCRDYDGDRLMDCGPDAERIRAGRTEWT